MRFKEGFESEPSFNSWCFVSCWQLTRQRQGSGVTLLNLDIPKDGTCLGLFLAIFFGALNEHGLLESYALFWSGVVHALTIFSDRNDKLKKRVMLWAFEFLNCLKIKLSCNFLVNLHLYLIFSVFKFFFPVVISKEMNNKYWKHTSYMHALLLLKH